MSELLVTVYCPSVSKSYDFWIPGGITVKSAVDLLCDDICAYENNPGIFAERETLLLCSYLNRNTLPMETTMEQAGVRSGDRLALV
jgi:hypothetical protein